MSHRRNRRVRLAMRRPKPRNSWADGAWLNDMYSRRHRPSVEEIRPQWNPPAYFRDRFSHMRLPVLITNTTQTAGKWLVD